jgi:zinc protease
MAHARLFRWMVLVLVALAGSAQGAVNKVQTIEGITEYRLDNGLMVLLYPDVSKPTVTVNLTVLVGSRHEGYGETGMAHLLEHMVFK